jgi:hypothetical protein
MALSRERKLLQSRRELLRIPWHLQREISKTIYALLNLLKRQAGCPVDIHAAMFEFGQSVFA